MTASELLKVLEGVPDEALPENFRLRLKHCDDMASLDDDVHAAAGAMVAWLERVEIRDDMPEGAVVIVDEGSFTANTLLEALAAAVRAVTATQEGGTR